LYAEEALAAMKRGTRRTLIHVLDQILKLLHPIMPFITEKIWQLTNGFTSQQHESIMISSYPVVNEKFIMPEIEEELRWVKDISQALRTLRSEMNISPAKGICLYIKNANAKDKMYLEKYQSTVISLSKLISCEVMDDESIPLCASLIVNHLELLIPMADLIDKKAELLRVEKELAKLSKDISLAEVKLNNVAFTDKAPQDVIEKERKKHQEASIAMEKLRQHQKMLIQL
jgi:valyl-tRNA synthetase